MSVNLKPHYIVYNTVPMEPTDGMVETADTMVPYHAGATDGTDGIRNS